MAVTLLTPLNPHGSHDPQINVTPNGASYYIDNGLYSAISRPTIGFTCLLNAS